MYLKYIIFNMRRLKSLLQGSWEVKRIDPMAPGNWDKSHVFPVVAVGLWYAYSMGCHYPWCETRPGTCHMGREVTVVFSKETVVSSGHLFSLYKTHIS